MHFLNRLKTGITLLLLVSVLPLARAQLSDTTIFDWRRGLFPKEKESEIYQLKINGFYRFFATHLYMDQPYLLDQPSSSYTNRNTFNIFDDSQLPNLLVNVTGRPNKKVSWGFDVFMFQFLNGVIGSSYNGSIPTSQRPNVWDPISGSRLGQNMGLNLGLNLYGSYITSKGTFNVRLGGIHWFSISDLTLKSFQGYNRFMLYERNPWDPIGKQIGVRYHQMYEFGAVYQDLRWGERAVQGLIVEGLGLPDGWTFATMIGKTELAGGLPTNEMINYGGKLKKSYANSSISLNTLNSNTYTDSAGATNVGFNMLTLEWEGNVKGLKIKAEAGPGRYVTPIENGPWGEAITLKVLATEALTKIPIELHYFRINRNVFNNNGLFFNTSLDKARNTSTAGSTGTQSANALIPFASSMVGIGQMTNNRTGVNLNTEFKLGELKVSVGYGISTEIDSSNNTITFSHFVNQLTRSRFWRWNFPQNVGPYQRYNVVYRDAFQQVTLTDDSLGAAVNTKKFNNLEVHAKYRTKLGYRNFFAFFLGRYNTAQPEFSILPQYSEKAYIRQYNSELEMYYQLAKPLFVNAYLGYERVLGNYQTELNSQTFRPLNQTGWGVGVGVDISLGQNAGLFLRHRWFYFDDSSYALDTFKGQETLAELKVFF